MLRFSSASSSCSGIVSAAATFAASASLSQGQRSVASIPAKGRCEYRLDYTHAMKRGPDALRDIKEGENKRALKNPTSKKEKLAHLTERPSYEYKADFQRWADDMMAIQSDPRKFCDDMSYHFVRVGKHFNGSQTWLREGNSSCGQFNKLKAPN